MVSNLFVTESVPNNLKSTAGAVFNTVISLANTIGLGAGAAVANAVANKRANPGESAEDFLVRTYQSAYWFATGATIVGAVLCFFVKVGRQGHDKPNDIEDSGSEHAVDDERAAAGVVQSGGGETGAISAELSKEIGISQSPMLSTMSLDTDEKTSMKVSSPGIPSDTSDGIREKD
ncbi:hypothetical protein ABW20_dc0102256 [Dactylellina cionopaga]|nr:hypothetical protein ABW20_dc0102256 [Dactylellina cionopaga]